MNNPYMMCDINHVSKASSDSKSKMTFIQLLSEDNSSNIKNDHISQIITQPRIKLKSTYFSRPKIKTMKIKTLLSNETLSNLPFNEHQRLISLLPECDKVFTDQTTDAKCLSPSKTALNNEFFNRALIRFLCKLTNGKSVLSTESFISRIKNYPTTISQSSGSCVERNHEARMVNIATTPPQSNSSSIRLDYDIKDAKINYNSGIQYPTFLTNEQLENQSNFKRENIVASPNYSFDNQFVLNPLNNYVNSEFEVLKNEYIDSFSSRSPQLVLSPISDSVITTVSSKHKRRNSGGSLTPIPSKRPTRSTAGQLPARLKSSSSLIATTQGTIVLALSNGSHSTPANNNRSVSDGTKSKDTKKQRVKECDSKRTKLESFHNDTILFNLRTKLSNRIRRNSLKDHDGHYNSIARSTDDISYQNQYLSSTSPRSISPESDKLLFIDSPIMKNSLSNYKPLKFRNSYFENHTPSSPQWSFSSEFTSQSSVESVLSQKNIKGDIEDIMFPDNLLDDMGSEEMPPPRRTLTVAAMREKMRAKKMAKEEKRKDFSFDVDKIEEHKNVEDDDKDCDNPAMQTMMNTSRDNEINNDDDNITNDFDSFLIDDYQVEIDDDKILNYSDDLDELLMSGGSESLLEIIMKDPDAMDINNDTFSNLHNDCHHPDPPMVSSDQNVCSFSEANVQYQGNMFNSHEPVIPVSSFPGCGTEKFSSSSTKDCGASKSALQNAYLVDGNGLSDALKLIQRLHPSAKVTTQQYFLVNSGPQLVLSQAPPTKPVSVPPVKSAPLITTTIVPSPSRPVFSTNQSLAPNNLVFTGTKPPPSTQAPVLPSTISVLPPFTSSPSRPSTTMYSFPNKLVPSAGGKVSSNHVQYPLSQVTLSSSSCAQNNTLFANQKLLSSSSVLTNHAPSMNTFGIRVQLAPTFSGGQQLSILQPTQTHMSPFLMNQPLQFLSPSPQNSNISLLTQTPQPMSKLVLLYPNLNCSQISTDSFKTDTHPQQVILLSQKEQQPTPASFQVLQGLQGGAQVWQHINPHLGTILGSNGASSLVLMSPQTLTNTNTGSVQAPFSFNYQTQNQQPLLMMSTNTNSSLGGLNSSTSSTIISPPTALLSIKVSKPDMDDSSSSMKPHSVSSSSNMNSNSSQTSCMEQLSNSSSSANSKVSFDDKSSCCPLSKCQSDNLTDSDQEKSINSPQFQAFTSGTTLAPRSSSHLTVDMDASVCSSPSSSFYHHRQHKIPSPDTNHHQVSSSLYKSHKLRSPNRNQDTMDDDEDDEEEEDFDR